MTKEITKASILQQIQDKFALREFLHEPFLFSETVVPIYDIEPHLEETIADYEEKSVTTTGGLEFFTVPANERWFMSGYTLVFMGAGAYTVSGVYLRRVKELRVGSIIYLDLTAGIGTSYTINLPKVVRLDPGDRVFINIDGYTSPQNLRLYIDYIKETIR